MRFRIHMAITAEDWEARDPQLTLSIDAPSDYAAQTYAQELFPDLEYDITEIEEAE